MYSHKEPEGYGQVALFTAC